MKFLIRENGKSVIVEGKVVNIDGGEYETSDKKLQVILLKCKGVKEVKSK